MGKRSPNDGGTRPQPPFCHSLEHRQRNPWQGNTRSRCHGKNVERVCPETDPTRPVTGAVNGLSPDKDPFFTALDVAGYNYAVGGDHRVKDTMPSITNVFPAA